jgi:hypothetical protein
MGEIRSIYQILTGKTLVEDTLFWGEWYKWEDILKMNLK